MEVEEDSRINYLDLTIKINKTRGKIEYGIYRKPTATDTIIHNTSNHPQQHKNAAIRQLVTRLEKIPLSGEAYAKELQTIYTIATNNGYRKDLVDKIRSNILQPRRQDEKNKDEKSTWTSLTYMGKSTFKLAKFFRKHNINTAFKTMNNLGKILRNNTNDIDTLDKQGVYKLTCTCQHSYIGQTGRKIKTRFREHIRDFNKRLKRPETTPESNFANHMFENKCTPAHIRKTVKLVHSQQKGRSLNVLENMEIYKQKTFDGRIINEQINTASDVIFEPLKHFYTRLDNRPIQINNADTHNTTIVKKQTRTITDFFAYKGIPSACHIPDQQQDHIDII